MKGWHGESMRHGLAARGIRSGRCDNRKSDVRLNMDRNRFGFIVSRNGKDVGFILGDLKENTIENCDLYVDPDYRRCGIAHELLKNLISYADKKNITIIGEVALGDPEYESMLLDLYDRYGFQIISTPTVSDYVIRYPGGEK